MGDVTHDWVRESVAAARAEHDVPDEVATLISTSLQGTMRERPLRDRQQSELAKKLLAAMTPSDPEGEQDT